MHSRRAHKLLYDYYIKDLFRLVFKYEKKTRDFSFGSIILINNALSILANAILSAFVKAANQLY